MSESESRRKRQVKRLSKSPREVRRRSTEGSMFEKKSRIKLSEKEEEQGGKSAVKEDASHNKE